MLKGLFGASRQAKRDDAELGKGVWRRDHDRFRRGLDRFHQMLEGLEAAGAAGAAGTKGAAKASGPASGPAPSPVCSEGTYQAMVMVANNLADLLPIVHGIVMEAQRTAPSDGMEVPLGTGGYLNDVHRELSRSGNALAAAAEALALVRLGVGEASGVELKAAIVARHVERAGELLHKQATS